MQHQVSQEMLKQTVRGTLGALRARDPDHGDLIADLLPIMYELEDRRRVACEADGVAFKALA